MHVSVPIVAILACLGIYGCTIGMIALRSSEKQREGTKLKKPMEWIAVISLSFFGFIGWAIALASAIGSPPYTPYLIATPIVGILGVIFFRMLEISPAPIFALLIDTRHLGGSSRAERRSFGNSLRKLWAESSIDGDVLKTQKGIESRVQRRRAISGAFSLASIVIGANLVWLGQLVAAFDLSMLLLTAMIPLYGVLVWVFIQAGKCAAKRAPELDWRRPF